MMVQSTSVQDEAQCDHQMLFLVCSTEVIKNEIAHGLRMKDIVTTYAHAIRSEAAGADNPNWTAINGAIIERWGGRGLTRVKNAAWRTLTEWDRAERKTAASGDSTA